MTRRLPLWRPVLVAAALGLFLTLLVSVTPLVPFAYFAPSLHVGIETASGLAALLAAYLVYGRFRHNAQLAELGLAVALALFGVINLAVFALPTALAGTRPDAAALWGGALGRLVAGVVFAAAAIVPPVRVSAPAVAGRVAIAGSVSAAVVIGGGVALMGWELPAGVDPAAEALRPLHSFGPPGLHILQLFAVCLFVAAGVGFARRALRTGDELLAWFATGSVLAAFAHLNYFLFPSLYSDWIYAGDVLRLAFYAVVLFASAQEIRRYWQRMAEAEVAEERRRLARELHDGVAQELAFIARRARTATAGLDPAAVAQICLAADRARSEARRAVAALSAQGDQPFAEALTQAVEHITAQGDVHLRTDVDGDVQLAPDVGEHLIRIACEAVSNAVRHSSAPEVRVELSARGAVRLRVADDGVGFDPDAVPARAKDAFGMVIMRERAERIGARLEIRSRPGAGAQVEVTLA